MSIANEISKLQQNLLDCYDVCADNGAYLPEDINFDNLANCIEQISNPFNKPADWSDIRKDCPENSIALYAGHTTDFSSYDNLGFTATCTGGYNVFIDGTQYGSTYASNAQCSITWSTSGITTGDIVTTPSAMKAHKIWIQPATEGNNITAFKCARVANSGREAQGTLWAHFNIDNEINLGSSFATYNSYYEPLMLSMTAKNNVIKCNKLPMFGQSSDLAAYADNIEYLPIFDLNNNTISGAVGSFNLLTTAELEKVILKNGTISGSIASFSHNATKLKKIITKNVNIIPTNCLSAFQNNQSIEEVPDIDFTNATNLTNFITNAVALKDTVLDTRAGTGITKIGCYGTSQYFMSGFKGLRVSNEAPFNNTTPPQINVSYTGMDRSALVQLFNDLPYNVGYEVVGSPTIDSNGIMTNTSYEDYAKTSLSIDLNNKVEFNIRFKTPSTLEGGNHTLFSTDVWTAPLLSVYGFGYYYLTGIAGDVYQYQMQNDTYYRAKLIKQQNSNVWTQYLYDDNGQLLAQSELERAPYENNKPICIGASYGSASPAIQAIDLSNTSISVNDVYWFRGQPTMTKTLSCVGATGTADLTAEDKDIALNKGWSITIS